MIAALDQAIAEDGAFAAPGVERSAWRRAGVEEALE